MEPDDLARKRTLATTLQKYPDDLQPASIVRWLRTHADADPDYATRCALYWAASRIETKAAVPTLTEPETT